ncbi:hypothetical protein CALCODRAFT_113313 [Calocera cornea HHB12733]|uniref:Uncharacterized protein n=1 Tax=Calocera cornea HHB12733 TaxID=1353952 RepID=A0A165D0Y7_9BASI|nr:hypothetical protein CALCODRAFT_113313 [Calocera cornea HHB12733]
MIRAILRGALESPSMPRRVKALRVPAASDHPFPSRLRTFAPSHIRASTPAHACPTSTLPNRDPPRWGSGSGFICHLCACARRAGLIDLPSGALAALYVCPLEPAGQGARSGARWRAGWRYTGSAAIGRSPSLELA